MLKSVACPRWVPASECHACSAGSWIACIGLMPACHLRPCPDDTCKPTLLCRPPLLPHAAVDAGTPVLHNDGRSSWPAALSGAHPPMVQR